MQSITSQSKQNSSAPGLKQVKVDNWGTFFLQRLQQLYADEELLDLTIKFPTSDITVQAHRLVITTCTDYFTQLERKQKEKDKNFNGVLIMPTDMPYECVKSIISFMYTGQLDYWTSEQNALYRTAQKMNMAVLTKLLDAQFNTNNIQSTSTSSNDKSIGMSKSVNLMKKTSPNQSMPTTTLPGRKLPIWRRKLDNYPSPMNSDLGSYYGHRQANITSGPSRFDLPEVEDIALGVFSSFDDITYNTKPIVQATGHSTGQSGSGSGGDRFADHSSSGADGPIRNYATEDEDDDEHDSNIKQWDNSDDDWTGPKSILRPQEIQPSPAKRVRFELEEKENVEKMKNASARNSTESINNHAKIIREVLKKYPHLVKNNKNIRLKIMQKETKTSEHASAKTKVSYVVLKSDHLMSGNNTEEEVKKETNTSADGGETGPWKCNKCDLDEEYLNYYMYRRHMQDVHDEKFDPRVCEHCGYKATKRNILMYHLYTKHNVPPPKSMSFPKCHACNYVALSETLLVRHQINHDHRSISSRSHLISANEVHCVQCGLTFKDVTDLASHEMNTGHGSSVNGKEKGYRCPHCYKVFVRSTNLQVHIDCAHKDLREPEPPVLSIPLEPSSEAEALSHVASGIAASLGVGDTIISDQEEINPGDSNYIVSEMDISNITQNTTYNGHNIEGQQMIMLIDNGNYHHHHQQDNTQSNQQPQPQQLEISSNEQLVMQGTDEGMIVYIHGNEEQPNRQTYEAYHEEVTQETEEIVEEVVEEVEEEVLEEELDQGAVSNSQDGSLNEQVEEVIQYVEEETEIVEYDDEHTQNSNDNQESRESMMIIEEEHLERDDDSEEKANDKEKGSQHLADEWNDEEDSMEMVET